ncbi:hypothetical protein EDD17DRAFT_1592050 [Pisolithus thermaeus]|nr:hypothetical protein EDD17DRAFT_1592050 [Pisolithus thermaeus]
MHSSRAYNRPSFALPPTSLVAFLVCVVGLWPLLPSFHSSVHTHSVSLRVVPFSFALTFLSLLRKPFAAFVSIFRPERSRDPYS